MGTMDVSTQLDQWVLVLNAVKAIEKSPEQFKLKQDFSKTLVEELLQQVAEHFHLNSATIYFMCWGRILDKKNSLESYGIKNGTLMIVRGKNLPPPEEDDSLPPATIENEHYSDNGELSRLTLETAFNHRKALKYLNKHSFPFARSLKTDEIAREKFMKGFPEIAKDPSLFAVFTEISTISAFLDARYLHDTLKRFPTFLNVTEHFIDLWKDEISKNPNLNADLNNLFILSDDEEESDTQDGPPAGRPQQHNRGDIARNMVRQLTNMLQPRNSRRMAQQQPQSSSGAHITSEMLQSALQSSMPSPAPECAPLNIHPTANESRTATSSSNSSSSRPTTLAEQLSLANSQPQTPTSTNPPERSAQVQTLIDRLPQLQAMRELGITDEIVAIQALEAANGDLEAAVNIIFSEDN